MMGEAPTEVKVYESPEPGHEESDAAIRPLAIFLGGLAGSLVGVALLVWLLFQALRVTINNTPTGSMERKPPHIADKELRQPALQVSPRRDLETLRKNEDRVLGATEWIDRDRKIARIPIDVTMAQIANHGLPKWPPAVEKPPTAPSKQPPVPDRSPPEQAK